MDIKLFQLMQGDFLERSKEIEESSVDLIVTDPPYGVDFSKANYDDSEEYVLGEVDFWFKRMYELLKDDKFLLMFVSVKQIHNFIIAGLKAGFEFKNIIATRSFNNGSRRAPNNFGFQFQPVLMFSKGKGRKTNDVDGIPTSKAWFDDVRNKNPKEYTYEYPNWIKTEWFFATEKRSSKPIHPNEKNVDFIKFLIQIFSDPNENILDPFMGSGSTGIAAIKTGRGFIGIELDKEYFDKTKERLIECL